VHNDANLNRSAIMSAGMVFAYIVGADALRASIRPRQAVRGFGRKLGLLGANEFVSRKVVWIGSGPGVTPDGNGSDDGAPNDI
jgi:hypothetical protein